MYFAYVSSNTSTIENTVDFFPNREVYLRNEAIRVIFSIKEFKNLCTIKKQEGHPFLQLPKAIRKMIYKRIARLTANNARRLNESLVQTVCENLQFFLDVFYNIQEMDGVKDIYADLISLKDAFSQWSESRLLKLGFLGEEVKDLISRYRGRLFILNENLEKYIGLYLDIYGDEISVYEALMEENALVRMQVKRNNRKRRHGNFQKYN